MPLAIVTGLTWLLVGWFTLSFLPEEKIGVMSYELGVMNFFFPLVFLMTFSFFTLILNNLRWGLLGGLGITVFLILRFLKLTSPFYLLILLLTLIALEVAFRKS